MPRRTTNPIRMGLFFILAALVLAASGWYIYNLSQHLFAPLSERYRAEADVLLAEGHLPEAVLTYRQAVEADGGNAEALQSLAEAYRQQGRLRMSERYQARREGRQPVSALPISPDESGLSPSWITPVSEAVPLGGSLADGLVVTAHEDGTVVAVEAGRGALIWTVRLPAQATSAPAAGEGLVLVGANDGKLYALSLADGQDRWQLDSGGPIYAAPLMAGGVVYCPSSSGTILAVKASDGSILWKQTLGSALNGSPALANGRLYLGSNNGRLYALNAADGSPAWPEGILTGGAVEGQPVIIEQRLILGSGDGRVYAFDAASGGQYWRASTPDAVYAAPLVLEGRVYIASSGRSLSAVDLISGKRVWQAQLPAPLRNPPAAAGDRLYLAGESDTNLYVIDQETGKQISAVPTGDWIAAGPWIDGQMLYLLGKDGSLAAYTFVN